MELVGKSRNHLPDYAPEDWIERDDFDNVDTARTYARQKARMYPSTPYRIVQRDDRYVVEFVPEWNLRTGA